MYPAGGRKVFYLRKEQFIMIMLGNIAHFVAWILSLTGDKEEEYYFDLVADILGGDEIPSPY